jgi:hypothetical protein
MPRSRTEATGVMSSSPIDRLRNLVLPSAGGSPQHLSFGCVQLQSVAAHPKCYIICACGYLLQQLMCCRRGTSTIDLRVVGVKMSMESAARSDAVDQQCKVEIDSV